MSDIVERLRAACTDWDGTMLPPGSEPMDGLHCDVLIEAADQIEWLSAEARARRDSHIETLNESIATITALRQQLAEAREALQAMHRRAQAAEAQTLFSREQAAKQSNEARRTGWIKFHGESRREWTLRDREEARVKALQDASDAISSKIEKARSFGVEARDLTAMGWSLDAVRSLMERWPPSSRLPSESTLTHETDTKPHTSKNT